MEEGAGMVSGAMGGREEEEGVDVATSGCVDACGVFVDGVALSSAVDSSVLEGWMGEGSVGMVSSV